jgi:hypothetical protein
VFGAMKKMWQWGQGHLPEGNRLSFFELMGQDVEIVKVV